ncbi:hypothetical protein N9L54_01445 [Porticoccaceae bacterium]|nr:hypothetical protein [Porticoccaceae bacterium]
MSQRTRHTKKHIERASKSSGVSYQGSNKCIDGYLKSVRESLISGETVQMRHLGTIDAELQFIPTRAIKNAHVGNYLNDWLSAASEDKEV